MFTFMEKRKRIEAVNGEFQLPEAIIQHIQSFLSGKEAAQTTIFSKSWYNAWSTRPNLEFDQRQFWNVPEGPDGFSEISRKTMQRYESLNRKIESLRLWMNGSYMGKKGYNHSLATELILKSVKMGARDLHLEFSGPFVLPQEVLASETLTSLCVTNCKIKRGLNGKVGCSRLKSLNLCKVIIARVTIWDIISSCPSIEELILSECISLSNVQLYGHRITKMLALKFPIKFGEQNVESNVDSPLHPYVFDKLKLLFFEMVEINGFFFNDFSSKFPCVKDLTIHHCVVHKQIRISSHSLERISLAAKNSLSAKFDVPKIRKFSFSGSCLPSLFLRTTSRKWESDISLLHGEPDTLSLVMLKNLLKCLSQSKISLTLNIVLISEENFEYVGDVGGSRRPIVENLTLWMKDAPSSICYALLGCLFWSCRPKFITQYQSPKPCVEGNDSDNIVEILCKRLIQQVDLDCYIPNRRKFGQGNLNEVNVEFFEETVAVWRPVPWKVLLDALKSSENIQKFRFRLRWGKEHNMLG